jgi:aspartyl-tRNA(Asn)/glutamyl-tRNA(Gln) amidotransferase subunit B
MMTNQADPIDIVKEKGWMRIADMDQLATICNEIIKKNSEKVSFSSTFCILSF